MCLAATAHALAELLKAIAEAVGGCRRVGHRAVWGVQVGGR
jgi:hypothetical protein